jgi:hypothetical protein
MHMYGNTKRAFIVHVHIKRDMFSMGLVCSNIGLSEKLKR